MTDLLRQAEWVAPLPRALAPIRLEAARGEAFHDVVLGSPHAPNRVAVALLSVGEGHGTLRRAPHTERHGLHVGAIDERETEKQLIAVGKVVQEIRGGGTPQRQGAPRGEIEPGEVDDRPSRLSGALGTPQNLHPLPRSSDAVWAQPEMACLGGGPAPPAPDRRGCEELREGSLLVPDRIERPAAEVRFQPWVQAPPTRVLAQPGEVPADAQRPPEAQPSHVSGQPLRWRERSLPLLDDVKGGDQRGGPMHVAAMPLL